MRSLVEMLSGRPTIPYITIGNRFLARLDPEKDPDNCVEGQAITIYPQSLTINLHLIN